jgi:serine/threonine protein kinase
MIRHKKFHLDEIGIPGTYSIEDINSIPLENISKYSSKEKHIKTKTLAIRTNLHQEKLVNHGSYGNLYTATRFGTNSSHPVLMKQPRLAEMNLTQEAVLQHIAYKTMEQEGNSSCIPKVYDVFWKDNHVWFSMEQIHGYSILNWFEKKTTNADRDFLFLIAQMALVLWCLETHLALDHRDLKVDNLLIKPIASTTVFHGWTLKSPFTVVLLDFGFACLGSNDEKHTPIVNLGDGVLPPMDPCPKEGRDLFQLLISLISLKSFRDKISAPIQSKIDTWLTNGKKSYGDMARRWSTENWSYLVTSQANFEILSCKPENILLSIKSDLGTQLSRL